MRFVITTLGEIFIGWLITIRIFEYWLKLVFNNFRKDIFWAYLGLGAVGVDTLLEIYYIHDHVLDKLGLLKYLEEAPLTKEDLRTF